MLCSFLLLEAVVLPIRRQNFACRKIRPRLKGRSHWPRTCIGLDWDTYRTLPYFAILRACSMRTKQGKHHGSQNKLLDSTFINSTFCSKSANYYNIGMGKFIFLSFYLFLHFGNILETFWQLELYKTYLHIFCKLCRGPKKAARGVVAPLGR